MFPLKGPLSDPLFLFPTQNPAIPLNPNEILILLMKRVGRREDRSTFVNCVCLLPSKSQFPVLISCITCSPFQLFPGSGSCVCSRVSHVNTDMRLLSFGHMTSRATGIGLVFHAIILITISCSLLHPRMLTRFCYNSPDPARVNVSSLS